MGTGQQWNEVRLCTRCGMAADYALSKIWMEETGLGPERVDDIACSNPSCEHYRPPTPIG